jgi:hypothetical protein
MMQNTRRIALLTGIITVALLASGITVAFAQTGPAPAQSAPVDPDSNEFSQFAEALLAVEAVQQSAGGEIDVILNDFSEGQERFVEIHQLAQSSNGSLPSALPENVVAEYQDAISEINQIQVESQQEMIGYVQDAGLSVQRFNEIAVAVQQNPALQAEIQSYR